MIHATHDYIRKATMSLATSIDDLSLKSMHLHKQILSYQSLRSTLLSTCSGPKPDHYTIGISSSFDLHEDTAHSFRFLVDRFAMLVSDNLLEPRRLMTILGFNHDDMKSHIHHAPLSSRFKDLAASLLSTVSSSNSLSQVRKKIAIEVLLNFFNPQTQSWEIQLASDIIPLDRNSHSDLVAFIKAAIFLLDEHSSKNIAIDLHKSLSFKSIDLHEFCSNHNYFQFDESLSLLRLTTSIYFQDDIY